MLELLFPKTPKEEKKKFYMVTLVVWIILLICMLLMDFHIISDTEPNAIMYAVIIFGMINSIVQILRKEKKEKEETTMNFNYNEQEYEEFPNFKGGEKSLYTKMFHDEKNRIIYGKLIPGASIGVHTHETNSEIIYITKGTGRVLMDGEYEKLEAGMCHYCPKGHTHSLMNDSDAELEFFAVVPEQN